MSASTKYTQSPQSAQSDAKLVEECLNGSEEAWSNLIDKYKNLIYSIPVKYGFRQEDATDIFQSVCVALLSELAKVREPKALGSWLIRTTSRKCFRWREEHRKHEETELNERYMHGEAQDVPENLFREVEKEQFLREAVMELPADCRRLVQLLFFSNPPLDYDQAAAELGTVKGSIGPMRMRCLEKLRKSLDKKGFS